MSQGTGCGGLFVVVLAIVAVVATLPGVPPAVVEAQETPGRVAGAADPVVAAVDVADLIAEPGTVRRIVLSRSDVFADALAGSAVAGQHGLILFTDGGPDAPVRPEARDAIGRSIAPDGCVYILGGTQAVSAAAEQTLLADGHCVERIAGPSRVETALAAARTAIDLDGQPQQVLIARSDDWADAVTAGALAARDDSVLVVTPTAELANEVAAFLTETAPEDIVLLGGTAALSAAVGAAAAEAGPVRRLAGASRDETAAAISDELRLDDSATFLVNTYAADAWPYALMVAPESAASMIPQGAADTTRLPAITRDEILLAGGPVVVVGPERLISSSVATAAQNLTGDLSGPETTEGDVTLQVADGASAAQLLVADAGPYDGPLQPVVAPMVVDVAGTDLATLTFALPDTLPTGTVSIVRRLPDGTGWLPLPTAVTDDGATVRLLPPDPQSGYAGLDVLGGIRSVGGAIVDGAHSAGQAIGDGIAAAGDAVYGVVVWTGDAVDDLVDDISNWFDSTFVDGVLRPTAREANCEPPSERHTVSVGYEGSETLTPVTACMTDEPYGPVLTIASQRLNALGVSTSADVQWAGAAASSISELFFQGLYAGVRTVGGQADYLVPGGSDLSLLITDRDRPVHLTLRPDGGPLALDALLLSLGIYLKGAAPASAALTADELSDLDQVEGLDKILQCFNGVVNTLAFDDDLTRAIISCAALVDTFATAAFDSIVDGLGIAGRYRELNEDIVSIDHRATLVVNGAVGAGLAGTRPADSALERSLLEFAAAWSRNEDLSRWRNSTSEGQVDVWSGAPVESVGITDNGTCSTQRQAYGQCQVTFRTAAGQTGRASLLTHVGSDGSVVTVDEAYQGDWRTPGYLNFPDAFSECEYRVIVQGDPAAGLEGRTVDSFGNETPMVDEGDGRLTAVAFGPIVPLIVEAPAETRFAASLAVEACYE